MKNRVRLFYSGQVQGVGFRFTVQKFARRLGFNGWVRNLNDGRVEVFAQTTDCDITQLTNEIECHFETNIKRVERFEESACEEMTGFKIIS